MRLFRFRSGLPQNPAPEPAPVLTLSPLVATAVEEPLLTCPLPVLPSDGADEADAEFLEYLELAKRISLDNAGFHSWALPRFFRREEISLYPIETVKLFLTALANREGKIWCWVPLRKEDTENGWTNHLGSGEHGHLDRRGRYDKPMPIEILRLVDKISTAFPHAGFFVSDYATERPDPFIMVTGHGNVPFFVFGHWDEPDFKFVR